MSLKKRHKIMIGSFSSVVIIILLANSFFLYLLFIKLNMNQKSLEDKISELQADTQSKFNELTENVLETKQSLQESQQEISTLKAETSSDFSGIIEQVIKSVVTIRTDVSQGTGFIITDDGYIVTNAHILVGARTVSAVTSSQKIIRAEFIGYERELDIALLKISENYRELKLANSDKVQVGEKVIAIGNPLGLQFSVSEGIVSAINRPGLNGIEAYIQTDAALNPGNSGGPLINKAGEVVGINNFKIGSSESLGFALESNYIRDAVNAISESELNQTLV